MPNLNEDSSNISDRRAGTETVDHPAHYGGDTPHETIKCLESSGLESDALLWNAAKYISRAAKKGNPLEDLEKARWYLTRRIAQLETADAAYVRMLETRGTASAEPKAHESPPEAK